jgi:MFS family permease
MTTDRMGRPRSPFPWRLVMALGCGQIVSWAILFYAFALLAPRIMAETGWSKTLVFGGFSLALLVQGLASPAVGRHIDRHGGRLVLVLGPVVGALGLTGLALSTGPVGFLASMAVMGLGMSASLYDPAFATIARAHGQGARRIISTLTLLGGLASTVSWPLTRLALEQLDWRTAALGMAGLLVLLGSPLNALALAVPAKAPGAPPAPEIQPHDDPSEPIAADRRLFFLGLFALVIAAHGFITSALSVHLIAMLDQLGLSEREAVAAGMLIGPAQVLARLAEMAFAARIPALALGLIATGLMPLAFLVVTTLGLDPVVAGLFALIYGASNGLVTIARGVVPLALFGRRNIGRTLGLLAAPALAVKAAAPTLMALMVIGWGWSATLVICAALALLAFGAMIAIAVRLRARAS